MIVCAHGDVSEFCEEHEMLIFERHIGNLEDYNGSCAVLVTDQKMSGEEYDSLKCKLFGRGLELVSTEWSDDETILRLLRYSVENRARRGGRQLFGFYKKHGLILENPNTIGIARRVIELRDAGLSYREIQKTDGIAQPNGRELGTSTLQAIVMNRERYEKNDELRKLSELESEK